MIKKEVLCVCGHRKRQHNYKIVKHKLVYVDCARCGEAKGCKLKRCKKWKIKT